ncbi:MAG: six-cysteine ranthipeptide SCIFF [Oscillospiraceae bacterium]|nr:six-cysteine ranthipeptide SCIFF [Oscillospiraceae bacterium]
MKHIRTLSKAAPGGSSAKSDCGKCKCVCMPACRMSVTVAVQKDKVKK